MWAGVVLTLLILVDGKSGAVARRMALLTTNAITDDAPGVVTRVRSTQRFMVALIREGYDRSPERKALEELFIRAPESTLALLTEGMTALRSPRVRSTDAELLNLVREGTERSTRFRELVDTIAESRGFVYLEFGYCAFGHVNGCLLPFIATSHGDRYLRILVTPDKHRVTHDQLLALIAHELQHALEVIQHEEVVDVATMEAMYRKIGVPLTGGLSGYETSAARAAGDSVLSELLAKPPSPFPRHDR